MKKTTLFSILIISLFLSSFTSDSNLTWYTNLETAQKIAQKEEKLILLSFSGSDWCSNCIRLQKSLFESPEFESYAKEVLVLVNADFPMKKKNKLSKEQTMYNEELSDRYNKKGVLPVVLVLDANGEIKGKMKHPFDNASGYIKNIKSIVEK